MPKFVALSKVEGRTGAVYYPLTLGNAPEPPLKESQLRVKIHATSLNHRDLFIRQALYPGVGFGIPILADACGTVVSQAPGADTWLGKRVIINPGSGWERSPDGPEDPMGYHALGGTRPNPNGTLQESMVVDQSEVEEAPSHLTSVEAAALPLTGLTAWRAVMVKCGRQNLGPGRNILVTGIGGGVALMALKFAAASGANVYVTSGSEDKIQRALGLGAKGGVNYKDADWEKSLLKNHLNGQLLDAIVDGAGGDVVSKGVSLLKPGGVISVYGMTTGPKMLFLMQAVLKNIEIKGSTMGSRKEFKDMVDYVKAKRIKPPVSRVVQGLELDAIDSLFDDMRNGSQFGKLAIEITPDAPRGKL